MACRGRTVNHTGIFFWRCSQTRQNSKSVAAAWVCCCGWSPELTGHYSWLKHLCHRCFSFGYKVFSVKSEHELKSPKATGTVSGKGKKGKGVGTDLTFELVSDYVCCKAALCLAFSALSCS